MTKYTDNYEILNASEDFYKIIINNLMDMIIVLDLKGNFIYVSPQVYDISGFKQDEVIGKSGFKFMHPDDINQAAIALKEGIEQKKKVYFEYQTIHKKGYYIDVAANGRIVNMNGEDRVFAIVRDISEQKRSERKLRESEEKYRQLIEDSLEGVWVIDENANTTLVNSSMANLLGYEVEEMIGKNLFDFTFPEDIESTKRTLENRKKGLKEKIEKKFIRKDGGEVNTRLSSSPIFNYDDVYKGAIAFVSDITERKRSEEKLRESEEKFRNIAEQSFMGIMVIQDGLFKYFNEMASEINGYSMDEIRNWKPNEFAKILHPEDKEFVMEQAAKKQAGDPDVVNHYQTRIIRKEGDIRWLDLFSKTIMYEGSPADLVMNVDITDKINAEQQLRESEEKFRNIAEQSFMGIIVIQDGLFKYFNQRASEVNGYSIDEIKNWKPNEFVKIIHPEDKEFVMEQAVKKQAGDPDVNNHYQFRIIRKDGDTRWLDIFSKTINYEGSPADLAMTVDITDKINAEQQLKESEEKFRNIAEQSFMGIMVIQDGLFKYFNERASEINGYSMDEIRNWKPNEFAKILHPEDKEFVMEQAAKKQEGDPDVINHYQFRIIRKEGDTRWLDLFSKTIMYEGSPADLVMNVDITEKKEAEQELVKLNSLKSELMRRTSHELKTPLVSIKGYADLLLSVHKDKLDNYVLASIVEIKQGCERLENLIQDILNTAELESGVVQLKKIEEDLSFFVKLSVRELQGLTRLRNQTVISKIKDKLITSFEPEQIHRVISNLINNAIKYTPVNGKIEIDSEVKNGYITISVKDSGIGITEDEKERLFTQFGKIERYGQGHDIISEGSGLGLYISKKVVELHGGKIWVESQGRNKGSTFHFTLPIIQSPSE